jgi:hypothetical protein
MILSQLLRLTLSLTLTLTSEYYWFNPSHFVGYMWFINTHRGLKDAGVYMRHSEIQEQYVLPLRLLVHICIAAVVYSLYKRFVLHLWGFEGDVYLARGCDIHPKTPIAGISYNNHVRYMNIY